MKKLFITVFMNYLFVCLLVGQSNIDSLNQLLLIAKEDTNKVVLYTDLAFAIKNNKTDSAIYYTKCAHSLAKKLKFTRGEAFSTNVLSICYLIQGNLGEAEIQLYNALDYAKQCNNDIIISNCYTNLGILYSKQGLTDKAIELNNKALHFYSEKRDKKNIAKTYGNMGLMYNNIGEYQKSMDYTLKSIEIYKELNNKKGVANAYLNIGTTYLKIDHNLSLEYIEKAFVVYQELDDKIGISQCLSNKGILLRKQNKLDEAMLCFNKSLQIDRELNNIGSIALNQNSIGTIFLFKKQYSKALYCMHEALNIWLKNNNLKGAISSYNNIGCVFLDMKNIDSAIVNLNKAKELAKKTNNISGLIESYKNLTNVFRTNGNFKESLQCYEKFHQLSDSTLGLEKQKQLTELEEKFKSKEKQKEIELKNSQLTNNELIIKNEKSQKLYLILGIFTLFIVAFFVIRFYRLKKETAEKIMQQNEEISKQKIAELLNEYKIKNIQSQISGIEEERKRISRELHDDIGSTITSVKLSLTSELKNENSQQILSNLSLIHSKIRDLSHSLSAPDVSEVTLQEIVFDYINKINNNSSISISFSQFPDFDWNDINPEIQIEIYRIIQESISNIIKHSQANEASIQLLKHPNSINLLIEDNGIGFNVNSKSKGIGLKNIKSRVDSLKGKINIDSKENNGTTIDVNIPI